MKTRMLGAVAALAAGLLVSAGLTGLSAAEDREFPTKNLPYPDVTDASHATDRVEDILEGFFSAKSLHNGTRMMTFWAPDPVLYIDAAAGPSYPTDFHDSVVNASPVIKNVAQALQTAFAAGDAAAATALFTPDAVFEDMALHTRVEGQLQIGRYLTRGLGVLPYGIGATVAYVVGSDDGGGYEWHAALSAAPLKRGNTALELDEHGKISRFTVIYDSFQFPAAVYQSLVLLAAEK